MGDAHTASLHLCATMNGLVNKRFFPIAMPVQISECNRSVSEYLGNRLTKHHVRLSALTDREREQYTYDSIPTGILKNESVEACNLWDHGCR